jgi:hypothetical protein
MHPKKKLYNPQMRGAVSLPLLRVTGVAPFLCDVGDLHPGVVDSADLPPARQHLPLRPHPLAVVAAGDHKPELQRPRWRLACAPRRPVVTRHEPPVRRTRLAKANRRVDFRIHTNSNVARCFRSSLFEKEKEKRIDKNPGELAYRCDVDGNDVGLAALVQEPDGQVARRPAPLLDAHRQVAARVLARHPAHESKFSRYCSGQEKKQNGQRDSDGRDQRHLLYTSCTRRRRRGAP